MNGRIQKVVILGGGTAGWMSALFLSRAFNRGERRSLEITLVESTDLGTIGVGESTIPTLRRTMSGLGLDEGEMMLACSASFKLGIRFANWSTQPAPDTYWHMFVDRPPLREGLPAWHAWLKERREGSREPFADRCVEAVDLCHKNKAPKRIGSASFVGPAAYAYHLDAGLLGNYLKQKSISAGVRHVVDNVVDVAHDEGGDIRALITATAGSLDGDLFIDCSGFRGRLINQAQGEPFESFADCLFCDRALATTVPLAADAPVQPFTSSMAMGAGWIWDIPLYDRRGVGYVYASAFCSDAQAETELLSYLRVNEHDRPIRKLRMRVGRTRSPWVGNCVAIGLSGGFVEPLEATGIFTIEVGLQQLWENFPNGDFNPVLRDRYNRTMRCYYDDIRDFLVLHYCLTRRQDTEFWRTNHIHPAVPDSLRQKLEAWRHFLPQPGEIPEPRLFTEFSYVSILTGMESLRAEVAPLPAVEYSSYADQERDLDAIDERRRVLRNSMPDHRAYLNSLREHSSPRLAP
jgi:tryptophan halogenase